MYVRIFIRPKMETYLFPAITVTRNSSFSPRLFVILQFRAEALLLPGFVIISDNDERAEDKTKKKTSKNVPKNSNDLKCFAGQVFVCGLEQWHRKFINEIFALDGRKEERERGQQETIFSKQKKDITTNQNRFAKRILHNSWAALFVRPEIEYFHHV